MANAKKCDRCGELFTGSTYRRRYQLQEDVFRNSTTPTIRHKPRDLCSGCYQGLEEWYEQTDIDHS